jgi:hypothetical protein
MTEWVNDNGLGMRISRDVLEDVCKRMIRIILFCLPDASRGTIYSVGPIPDLRVVRIASGRRNGQTDEIAWGAVNPSDYDWPGKLWEDYKDRPNGILEAMAWCVERQKSWTADDPEHNVRSLRKQSEGKAGEDYHHMEPVLVRKNDLWDVTPPLNAYPEDRLGKPIWQDSPYATSAVIKFHFLPGTIKQGDRSTKIIKELSRSLGTQMLSLHARETSLYKEKTLVEERQETCNALAHEFRNLLTRTGFAYRIANNEVTYLRELWEDVVFDHLPNDSHKRGILQQLNKILKDVEEQYERANIQNEISRLSRNQTQLLQSCFLPHQNEMWLELRIKPLWQSIMSELNLDPLIKQRIQVLLNNLRDSFHLVSGPHILDKIDTFPEELKLKWRDLVYREINARDNGDIEPYIELLDGLGAKIPHKKRSIRNFIYLKGLLELIPAIEERLNHRLDVLKKNG